MVYSRDEVGHHVVGFALLSAQVASGWLNALSRIPESGRLVKRVIAKVVCHRSRLDTKLFQRC